MSKDWTSEFSEGDHVRFHSKGVYVDGTVVRTGDLTYTGKPCVAVQVPGHVFWSYFYVPGELWKVNKGGSQASVTFAAAQQGKDSGAKLERHEFEKLPELEALKEMPLKPVTVLERSVDGETFTKKTLSNEFPSYDSVAKVSGKPLNKPVSADQGTKQDIGKPRWSQLLTHMPRALAECIKVREYGVEKYGKIAKAAGAPFDPEGWKKNDPQRYLESAQRHMMALFAGERVNEEDGGVNHAAQAVIDLLFMLELELNRKGEKK